MSNSFSIFINVNITITINFLFLEIEIKNKECFQTSRFNFPLISLKGLTMEGGGTLLDSGTWACWIIFQ